MPAPRRLRLPVPCTVVTGSLAAGKTTLLGELLGLRPPQEVWAVLVNEFGAAGLDAALLQGSAGSGAAAADSSSVYAVDAGSAGGGVHIKQLTGGCLCCALSSITSLAIAQLLRNLKPDRLLIEPSGLAHPAALVDLLRGPHLGGSLALQPIICLVDVTQFSGGQSAPPWAGATAADDATGGGGGGSQLLRDQVAVADILVGSKADLCDELALRAFHHWAAHDHFPPKARVATARRGRLDGGGASAMLHWGAALPAPAAASGGGGVGPGASVPALHQAPRPASLASSSSDAGGSGGGACMVPAAAATPERPQRLPVPLQPAVIGGEGGSDASSGGGHCACGWIFHPDCVFDQQRLQALLEALAPRALRLKGVFRLAAARWAALSTSSAGEAAAAAAATTAGAAAVLVDTAYRRDSRVELILRVGGHSSAAAASEAESGETAEASVAVAVAAALRSAAVEGDWAALEALLVATLMK